MNQITSAWNVERQRQFNDLVNEMLSACARLYHCAQTRCSCGDGKAAMEAAPDYIDLVCDRATATAFVDGIVAVLTTLAPAGQSVEPVVDSHKEFIALVACEACRRGGLLTERQIQDAITQHGAISAAFIQNRAAVKSRHWGN